MLHVVDIWKNFMFGSLLSKNNLKMVFESNIFILSKNKMFVGKEYLSDGILKMNVMAIITNDDINHKNNASFFTYFSFMICDMTS
jgi:hypothetical protein